jgi:CheY-like chemotaxis protein
LSGKILLVEDENVARCNVAQFLRDEGYEVFEAGNGATALELLTIQTFDLLVMDFVLPDVDGFKLIETVRTNWPNTPLLLMTGYVTDEAGKQFESMLAEVISKPVNLGSC